MSLDLDNPVSPIAVEFARRIAPKLKDEVESREAAIIADAGNFVLRKAVAMAFPIGVHLIPMLTEAGADAMLDEFGGLTLTEVASRLLAHNEAKGRQSHASLRGQG